MTEMMDVTPPVTLMRIFEGFRLNYVALIGEGIDNSLDADADSVTVTIDNQEITFEDDGRGITLNRIHALISPGAHAPMDSTALGRFGIGIKSQAFNAGDLFKIYTRSADGRIALEVDWRVFMAKGVWEVERPRVWPMVVGQPTGTKIVIGALRSEKGRLNLRKTLDEIALRFYPAIAAGKCITVNGHSVPLLPTPKLSDVVDRNLALSGGHNAHVRAGVICDGSKINKVHVGYKHRVIMPSSNFGCGDYSGITGMFARIQLSDTFTLSQYKDDLTNEDQREELELHVLEALRPILEKCQSDSMEAKIDKMAHRINDMVPESLAVARPNKVGQKKKPGKKEGKTGSVDADKSEPEGPAKTKHGRRDMLLITFDGDEEKDGIGGFGMGSRTAAHRVNLSQKHPFVAELMAHRDEAFGARCLLAIALAIFEEGRPRGGVQAEFEFAPFGKRIAHHLEVQDSPQASVVG